MHLNSWLRFQDQIPQALALLGSVEDLHKDLNLFTGFRMPEPRNFVTDHFGQNQSLEPLLQVSLNSNATNLTHCSNQIT